jgi:hypothetical protein
MISEKGEKIFIVMFQNIAEVKGKAFDNVSALPFVGKSQYYQVCRFFQPMKGSVS